MASGGTDKPPCDICGDESRSLGGLSVARPRSGAGGTSTVRFEAVRRGVRLLFAASAASAALANTGCASGIRWKYSSFDRVHAESRSANKLTFVYLRSWLSVACTEFEDTVLRNPAVVAATADMNCLMLNFDWDRPLAQQWDISRVPAFVILNPNGRILGRGSGSISADSLVEAIQQTKELHAQSASGLP